jgi:hypothetical protein
MTGVKVSGFQFLPFPAGVLLVGAGLCEPPFDQGDFSRDCVGGLLEQFLVVFHVSYDPFDASCLGVEVLHLDPH